MPLHYYLINFEHFHLITDAVLIDATSETVESVSTSQRTAVRSLDQSGTSH